MAIMSLLSQRLPLASAKAQPRGGLLDNNSYLENRSSYGHQIWYGDECSCYLGHV